MVAREGIRRLLEYLRGTPSLCGGSRVQEPRARLEEALGYDERVATLTRDAMAASGAATSWGSGLDGSFGVGLDQPLRSTGLAYPDGGGVVVVALALRIVFCAAVDGVDDVVGGEGGVRREDANLDVAEFVGLELAMLEGDHKGVDGLDAIVDLDEVFGEGSRTVAKSPSAMVMVQNCVPG